MNLILDHKRKNKFSTFDIIAVFGFLAALAFLVWRAHHDYVGADESFYLSVTYRIYQGDAMLVHEWHPGQLFAFLLYPALWLFMRINGSSEGIYLFFRLLFIAAQLISAVYIYIRLKKFQPFGALLGSLALMLYAPSNIMALCYNTIGLLCMAVVCVTIIEYKNINIAAPLCGLLFATAVLCCPYLVAVYVLYSLFCLVPVLHKKANLDAVTPAFWLRFTAACAFLAIVFLGFLLSRSSLGQIISSTANILNDPEHVSNGFSYVIFKYLESFFANFYFNSFALSIPLLVFILLIDKKRLQHRGFHLIIAMVITATYFLYYILEDRTVNYLMFPLNILGFSSFFLLKNKDHRPFVLIYIPGLLYSFCIHMASNLGLLSICTALVVSSLASALYIAALAKELIAEKKFLSGLVSLGLVAAIVLQFAVLCWFRVGRIHEHSNQVTEGPLKGVILKDSQIEHHKSRIADTASIRESDSSRVFYLTTDLWLYLMDDAKCGAFSSWISLVHPQAEAYRLRDYWNMYPETIPESIFVDQVYIDRGMLDILLEVLPSTWTMEATDSGYLLKSVS